MQFKKSAVVGVLITLYLSTDSWCHYIPEKKTTANKKYESSGKIQICGNALTTMIIEACDGIVGSLNQANEDQNSIQTKITEDCCDQQCPLEYLQNYCGQTPIFINNKNIGKLLEKLGLGVSRKAVDIEERRKKTKSPSEVRGKFKKRGKARKKRKRSFKWKCAFKSFGHYLLKLDHGNKNNRNNQNNQNIQNNPNNQNKINISWPSIEIGTISPEIDQFGGQPIVVFKKNKWNAI